MAEPGRKFNAVDLISAYFESQDDLESERILTELISIFVTPLVHEIVRYKLRIGSTEGTVRGSDAEEVCSGVLLKILKRLREWKNDPQKKDPTGFLDYVAVTSYHACNQYWRESHPLRNRIKNRLLYLLTSRQEFAMWKVEGNWVCGFDSWQNRKRVTPTGEMNDLRLQYQKAENKTAQLKAIFTELNAPMAVNDLVTLVLHLEGITLEENVPQRMENLPDKRPAIDEELQQREFLTTVWAEIKELPIRQRTALLLSLRDEHQDSILQILPALGIATIKQIAFALNIPADRFGELWRHLPMDDGQIALLLGITRQQVINLRKCARQRLSRRLMANSQEYG